MRLSFVMLISFDWRLLVSFLSRTVEDLQNIFGDVVPFLCCITHAPNNSLHALLKQAKAFQPLKYANVCREMVPVIFAPEAERDLDYITAYIPKDNPKALK
jgi:hypothetical protein